MEKNKKHNLKIKKKHSSKVNLFICIVISLAMILFSNCNKIYGAFNISDINSKESDKNEIYNILLLSSDARNDSDSERPDSIIILSIDKKNKEIRTTSIMRDSYVTIGNGHDDQKINHAYPIGGIDMMLDVVNKNYNIDIKDYIIVDFECFKKIIDLVDGLDITVKDYEVDELNKYILEYGTGGSEEDLIDCEGTYKFNGKQALSYARIRKVGDGDYERSQRQRYILSELIKKLIKTNPFEYPKILKEITPCLNTNLSTKDIVKLGATIFFMRDLNVKGIQMPVDGTSEGYIVNNELGWVLFFDKKLNRKYLNDFIYKGIVPEYKDEELDIYNENLN